MRKSIFILLMSILTAFSVKAQAPDTAFAAVKYTFLYVADTSHPTVVTEEPMILYIGKKMSAYRSVNRVLYDSALKASAKASELQFESGGPITFKLVGVRKGSSQACFRNFEKAKLADVQTLIRDYVIEEDMPVIKWNILPETKNIKELRCQKATTTFRGRNYIAWFCDQLPFDNGPWKLGGLPGLIVEAADDQNEVVFRFAGYDDISNKNIPIEIPRGTINATIKEFQRLREMADKDPHALMENSSASGSPMKFTNYPPVSIIQKPSKNPIERTHN
ncbi:MAG: GLPGLI family protein [Bacteroidota bacterium]